MEQLFKDLGIMLNATLMYTPPLLFAALGSCCSEKSGVVNIGIEGMMTIGAFTGAAVGYFSGNPWLAFLCAGLGGALFALLHAFACVTCKADQTISGTAINFLAAGIAVYVCRLLFQGNTETHPVPTKLPRILNGLFSGATQTSPEAWAKPLPKTGSWTTCSTPMPPPISLFSWCWWFGSCSIRLALASGSAPWESIPRQRILWA